MLKNAWTTILVVNPRASSIPEALRRATSARKPRQKKKPKASDQLAAPESKLFGDNREDEIGVWLRQKEEFLLALPESQPVYAARTDRDQRLQNLIALALRIAFGINKSHHPIPAPAD